MTATPLHLFYPDLPIVPYRMAPDQILFDDGHILLVYKPPGINTCPSIFSDQDCLSAGLQNLLDERAQAGGYPTPVYRINTINRLDRATSGLVLFAHTAGVEAALHGLFRDRKIRKRYLAATPAFENPRPRYKIRDTLEAKGKPKEAATLVLSAPGEGRYPQLFLWQVSPQTGRTHQIRIHFQRYLAPIWGDAAYGGGKYAPGETLHLACTGYKFTHPITGQRLNFHHWKGFY